MTLSWTSEVTLSLIDTPHRLLTTEPWRSWIIAQGGLAAVQQRLLQLPLPERERPALAAMVAEPGLTNIQYALRLNLHRVTFQRLLRRLAATLAAHLAAAYAPLQQPALPAALQLAPAGTVPAPLTSLIGRTAEVAVVAAWLRDPSIRLITLAGPGGIGKTRLAIQVAWETGAAFAHGLVFVPLAPVTEPRLVVPAISRALGLADDGAELEGRLREYLAPRHLCLVLDSAEHLLPAMPVLGRLLHAAPRLTILATSRARLGLYGERILEVPPLGVEQADADGGEPAREADALRLFAERARAVSADFALAQAAEQARAICERLDGLPLAIELAAAQLRHHSLATILDRLDQRLAFLTNGPRDAEQRHQSLAAAIGWSYDVLEPAAQILFARLSVLADGWTIAALIEICGFDMPPSQAERLLRTLLDHHLVRQRGGAEPGARFGMLETIRLYAAERLAARGE
ncbi:MAG TPA: hypothetical protein VGE07_31565 [Herpetosiphonaceae bacterium]